MDVRQQRAEQILATGKIHKDRDVWLVPSQSGRSPYCVRLQDPPRCSCEDWKEREQPCKHILAVQMLLERQKTGEPLPPCPETPPPRLRKTYSQDWPNYNAAQTNEKQHFVDLLADLCSRVPEPPRQGKGRKPIPLPDSLFAAVFKVYSTFSARRFMCDLTDAFEAGHLSRLPHFNSVLNALENPAVTPILFDLIRQSALPLREVEVDFAVDASGFLTSRFVRWFDVKYGTVKQAHEWVKAHVICGVKTNVVAAVEILGKQANDCPQLPSLVKTTRQGFTVREVSADKAYASRENFEAVDAIGGTLFAAFKTNTSGSVGGLFEKMFHLFCLNREEYLGHYHKRSNVESTFSMIKRKFGDAVRSKSDTAMTNEVLAKILCHNLCCLISAWYELGIEPLFGGGQEPEEPRATLRFPG